MWRGDVWDVAGSGEGYGGEMCGGIGEGSGDGVAVEWRGDQHRGYYPSVVKNRKMISLSVIHPPARSAINPAI